MDRTVIAWNVPNIISIWLMTVAGFLVAGLVAQMVKQYMGKGGKSSAATGGY